MAGSNVGARSRVLHWSSRRALAQELATPGVAPCSTGAKGRNGDWEQLEAAARSDWDAGAAAMLPCGRVMRTKE
jgi:hypothetical protein